MVSLRALHFNEINSLEHSVFHRGHLHSVAFLLSAAGEHINNDLLFLLLPPWQRWGWYTTQDTFNSVKQPRDPAWERRRIIGEMLKILDKQPSPWVWLAFCGSSRRIRHVCTYLSERATKTRGFERFVFNKALASSYPKHLCEKKTSHAI